MKTKRRTLTGFLYFENLHIGQVFWFEPDRGKQSELFMKIQPTINTFGTTLNAVSLDGKDVVQFSDTERVYEVKGCFVEDEE